MNHKGKFFALLTAVILCVTVMLVGCGEKPNEEPAHDHTFDMTTWVHGTTTHWHPANCEHKDQKGGAAAHVYGDDDTCDVCGYTRNTENGEPCAHFYEAYVCVKCGRDMMLEYVDGFQNRGTSSKPVEIDDANELISFLDYLYINHLYGQKWYLNITYYNSSLGSSLLNYVSDMVLAKTAGNYQCKVGAGTGTVVTVELSNDPKTYATRAPGNGYTAISYPKSDSVAYQAYASNRSATFDDFKYADRKYERQVTTSDQLFSAFEHGYRPIPVAGSAAERMLTKAKAVAREIMDDRMSDLEKVRAIYLWLVGEVNYDNGALVALSSYGGHLLTAYYLEGVFDYRAAVCDGIAKAYCVLAGLEDIRCVEITGTLKTGGDHAWNKVLIDFDGDGVKEWFGSDATRGNTALKTGATSYTELLNLKYFLFSDADCMKEMAKTYSYSGSGCDAVTDINSYEYFYFGEETPAYDFVIESREELVALYTCVFAWLEGRSEASLYINLFLTSSYCATDDAFRTERSYALGQVPMSGVSSSGGFVEALEIDGKIGFGSLIIFNK